MYIIFRITSIQTTHNNKSIPKPSYIINITILLGEATYALKRPLEDRHEKHVKR